MAIKEAKFSNELSQRLGIEKGFRVKWTERIESPEDLFQLIAGNMVYFSVGVIGERVVYADCCFHPAFRSVLPQLTGVDDEITVIGQITGDSHKLCSATLGEVSGRAQTGEERIVERIFQGIDKRLMTGVVPVDVGESGRQRHYVYWPKRNEVRMLE